MLNEFVHRFVPEEGDTGVTLLALHGTGGDENDLLPLAQMIAPDVAVLSPRGRVLEHGMPRYFRRLAEGVFDQEDLRVRTAELAAFLREAAAQYGFDLSRLVALGYSNGANIAASLLLSDPAVLAGAMLLRPMLPFEPEKRPDLAGKRVLVSAGRLDRMIPQTSTARLIEVLQDSRAAVTTWWHEAGHNLVPGEPAQLRDWFSENARSA